jgi:hypothetical protein
LIYSLSLIQELTMQKPANTISIRTISIAVLALLSVCDRANGGSFGPLTPSAAPCEREFIWPEGKMPNVQPHQIAAKTAEKKKQGFNADDFRRPYIECGWDASGSS